MLPRQDVIYKIMRDVTQTKCNLYKMLPLQSVLYENEPKRNVTRNSIILYSTFSDFIK